jgi:DNA invertase Pin-like site-specific DNA recombinase
MVCVLGFHRRWCNTSEPRQAYEEAPVIAFLYARVSTGEQNEGMQLREMQEYAARAGWKTEIFPDVGVSGAKDRRPELDRMMALVRRRKCDVVLVYRFDRFGRSLRHLVNALEEFRSLGVRFVSLHDSVDTTTPGGVLQFQIIGAMAEFERSLIRERVRSGMAHAKAMGKHVGRPSRQLDTREIARLRAQGLRWSEVSIRIGAGVSTCKRELRKAGPKGLCKKAENGADSKAFAGVN